MYLTFTCTICNKDVVIKATFQQMIDSNANKMLIQDAYPELTPAEREIMFPDLCVECFNKVFPDD